MTTFFTADLHLGEPDVMARCRRPWSSIDEHDAAIIARINDRVDAQDELYILGDVSAVDDPDWLRTRLDAITCKNRWLIVGNHDTPTLIAAGSFLGHAAYREIVANGHRCCLSHYPMLDWNKGDEYYATHEPDTLALMLHGHIHSCGNGENRQNAREGIWRYDVGVDANRYAPVSIDEIWDFFHGAIAHCNLPIC